MNGQQIKLVSDYEEVEEENQTVIYDEALELKYPCPASLQSMKHLFYTHVNIVGSNQLLLHSASDVDTGFKTRKFAEDKCKWVIYPLSNETVILRSALDGNHLSVWCDKGPSSGDAWGYVCKDQCEGSN